MIPQPWELALLALAAFRVWKLVADDTITDPIRKRWVEGHDWREALIECPWCAGTYITLAWWGAWQLWPHPTLVAAGAVALLSAVGLIASAHAAVTE